MYSFIYFPVISVLTERDIPATHWEKVFDGKLAEASLAAARAADVYDAVRAPTHKDFQRYADIQSALACHEDAEEFYRKAHKTIRQEKSLLRVESTRNAAWQAFFHARLSTAQMCFRRVREDAEASPERKMEALLGEIFVVHEIGVPSVVCELIEELADACLAHPDARWIALVHAVVADITVQNQLRTAEVLNDHVYWRSGMHEHASRSGRDVLAELAAAAASRGAPEIPIVQMRLAYLERLSQLASGRASAMTDIKTHLGWSHVNGIHDYQRAVRLEVALAAVIAHAAHAAESVLEPLREGLRGAGSRRWQLEYLYCMAKACRLQGRNDESLDYFGRYALRAMQTLRAESSAFAPSGAPQNRMHAPTDDVSARLPARYRRAYSYLMEHLDQRDLSVREVAAVIGVTERALQAAFKTHLGISPTEVIRKRRMERIRGELLAGNGGHTSVIDAASKWGVTNRSTLINGYRRQFQEAPSETLSR
ncbi:helix-turn-helix transcriptional regulator [Paraburkholderia youngii]|uniref:helix-turn-helix transcriptional regulator n=1 Tax=Paraburkholderia youngii TaxID=2782701 RepID=UPI003D238439